MSVRSAMLVLVIPRESGHYRENGRGDNAESPGATLPGALVTYDKYKGVTFSASGGPFRGTRGARFFLRKIPAEHPVDLRPSLLLHLTVLMCSSFCMPTGAPAQVSPPRPLTTPW